MRSIQCGRSGDKSRHPADETAFRRMAVDDVGALLADYPYCLPQGLHVFQQIKVALQCCQVFFHFPSVTVYRPAVVCPSVHDDVFDVAACEGYGVADIDIQAANELAYVENFHVYITINIKVLTFLLFVFICDEHFNQKSFIENEQKAFVYMVKSLQSTAFYQKNNENCFTIIRILYKIESTYFPAAQGIHLFMLYIQGNNKTTVIPTTIKDKIKSPRNTSVSYPITADKILMIILFSGSCRHIIKRLFLPKNARGLFMIVSFKR